MFSRILLVPKFVVRLAECSHFQEIRPSFLLTPPESSAVVGFVTTSYEWKPAIVSGTFVFNRNWSSVPERGFVGAITIGLLWSLCQFCFVVVCLLWVSTIEFRACTGANDLFGFTWASVWLQLPSVLDILDQAVLFYNQASRFFWLD